MHKIVKDNRSTEESDCKIYCFPDISCERLPDTAKGKKGESRFHPLQPTENLKPSSLPFDGENKQAVAKNTDQLREAENQAYERGFAEGEPAGRKAEAQKLESVFKVFRQALCEFDNFKRRLSENCERDIVTLAMAIARKIVLHDSAVNEQIIIGVAKEALLKAVDHENIRIRVNPLDLAYLQDTGPHALSEVTKMQDLALVKDECIIRGGCIIESDFGIIDARLEQQLQVIEEVLTSELQKLSSRD